MTTTLLFPTPIKAAVEIVTSVTADLRILPYVAYPDTGNTEILQRITIQFSIPQEMALALDPFNYWVTRSTPGAVPMQATQVSLNPNSPIFPDEPPPAVSTVEVWFNGVDNEGRILQWLRPETDYVLQMWSAVDENGNPLLDDEIALFPFRTPPLNQVPEPANLFVVLVLGAGLLFKARRTGC